MINVTARRTELLEAHRDPPAAENQRGKGHFLGKGRKGQTKIQGPDSIDFWNPHENPHDHSAK